MITKFFDSRASIACFVSFLLLLPARLQADIKLPGIFSNNMVLQRNVKVPIWGWADKGENVKVTFNGKNYATKPGKDGKWKVFLDPFTAGGPYVMTISGEDQIKLVNILIGEVCVCSGQSNMEMPVNQVKNVGMEIAAANYTEIRLFTVPKKIGYRQVEKMEPCSWQVCSSSSVDGFSAVAYFFGRKLFKELNIPVGLINTYWGGNVVETWMSADAANSIDDFKENMKQLNGSELSTIESNVKASFQIWKDNIEKNDEGIKNKWHLEDIDDASWGKMVLHQIWENAELPDFDGVVWFRREIVLSEKEASEGITLNLGKIDDIDRTYLNGQFIGSLDKYNIVWTYHIIPSILKPGKNVIAIKVIDLGGGGGIWGDQQDMSNISSTGTYLLAGEWNYKVGINNGPSPMSSNPNSFPTLLFNGMIYPMLPLAVRGAIWYQRESNASRAYQYQTVFPTLITDWRKQFNNPDMPFFFVQLANFMPIKPQPSESEWA